MTWHGGTAFKFVEKDAESKLSSDYVGKSKINSALTDLMLAASEEQFTEMRRAFWYDGEIMKSGLPRNDIFFNRSPEFINALKSRLNLPLDRKIMIYAPTFRDKPEDNIANCKINCRSLLEVLKKKFGGDWTILLRFHPNVSNLGLAQSMLDGSKDIIDVTSYPDPQELFVVSDMLISDYSSVIIDFMIMRKPVFLYARDFETYPKERGFKQLYFELPLARNRSEDELFECISQFDEKTTRAAFDTFTRKIGSFDDGHASERVVDRIVSVLAKSLSAEKFSTPPVIPTK